jgi:hypothetical protein
MLCALRPCALAEICGHFKANSSRRVRRANRCRFVAVQRSLRFVAKERGFSPSQDSRLRGSAETEVRVRLEAFACLSHEN